MFFPTMVSFENRELAVFPALLNDDRGINGEYLEELSDYISDHIALRNILIAIDAKLTAWIFSESTESSVIMGRDGWLYYAATLDDYTHNNSISDRELFNIAHNVALMQEYCELLGKSFIFTIAPNKNTLYGGHMPERYQVNLAEKSDFERLLPFLEKEGVHYVDLYGLFSREPEELYYKKDSHWNNQGALLVYNELLDSFDIDHKNYKGAEISSANDYIGDLNQMVFGMFAEPEEEVNYLASAGFFYWKDEKLLAPSGRNYDRAGLEGDGDSVSVEDTEVTTFNPMGEGGLLMYRDSFANSLIPLFSEHFATAFYSKQVPYPMTDLITKMPDYVLVEKVERHLPTLAEVPPVMAGLVRELPTNRGDQFNSAVTCEIKEEGIYYRVKGEIDQGEGEKNQLLGVTGRVYIEIEDEGGVTDYEAFTVSRDSGYDSFDDGFCCYIPALTEISDKAVLRVIIENEGEYTVAFEEEFAVT